MTPATTSKAATKDGKAARRKQRSKKTSADYLQDALDDLGKARDKGGEEVRASIEDAMERIRAASKDMRTRDWPRTLGDAVEDVRREFGRLAVHAQRTPDAISELTREIRRRRDELMS